MRRYRGPLTIAAFGLLLLAIERGCSSPPPAIDTDLISTAPAQLDMTDPCAAAERRDRLEPVPGERLEGWARRVATAVAICASTENRRR